MPHTTESSALSSLLRVCGALLFAQALLHASSATAEIFKCVAKDGSGAPLFQNFPCSIDSLGLSSNPSAAQPAASGGSEKSKAQPTAAPAMTANASEPRVGMSGDEVRALLGDPETVEEDEPGNGGRISTWRYAGGRTLQLDQKQRVFSIQE